MPDDLSPVLKPVAEAQGLPNAHYTSDETFAAERDRILFDGWTALTFASDLQKPSDARPIDFLGMPLLVLRDQSDTIRVFQNTCRHRGMILVSEPRRIECAIRCPYHSWCYRLTGELVATPHVGGPGHNTHPAIDRNTLGLIEIRSHIWRDIVFVDIHGQAAPFEDHAAATIARWKEFEGQTLHPGGPESRFSFDVACNWKLAVENYCESYHLPWVHPGLNSYSRLEDHYNITARDHSGQGTQVYRQLIGDGGQRFPDFADLSDKWSEGAEYIALYPNLLLGVHRDQAFAIILEPRAKDRTIEHVALYYADAEVGTPAYETLRTRNAEMWHTVFAEDVFVVEGMQRGRHGIHFDGGRFSPVMDAPTHAFHAWVAGRMHDGDADGRA
ncbi:aromatic ring-hydroxylating oxygenase subunit alpha [Aestuariibius sp. 2305UL40-4]|uniref:aromatic ring-hydroxylating oxygenase subunit alpha n=1 Tax=Aestuariibius violaceus TaxID=3234132 RepID=UPI00345E5216